MLTEAQRRKAFLAALVNYVVWGAWFGPSSEFQTIERIGPPLFWALPPIAAGVAWTLFSARARHRIPIHRVLLAAAAGTAATVLGIPVAILTGTFLAFAAFWPLAFIVLPLGMLLLFGGFAAMRALCEAALRVLENEPWTQVEQPGRRTTG